MSGGMIATLAAVALCTAAAAGCGERYETDDPVTTFAPLVQLAPDESHLPASAEWFIARSTLWYADERCGDRKVAVGTTLDEQWTPQYDWIYDFGLGRGPAYFRSPREPGCEEFTDDKVYANQHNRPFDDVERPPRMGPRDGFYLDLVDSARGGGRATPAERDGAPGLAGTPVYAERRSAEVGGEPGLRLTYWLMFPAGASTARPGATHEGDWERADVTLRGDAGEYEPVSLRLSSEGSHVTVPWEELATDDTGGGAHPVVRSARGTHALARGAECDSCVEWATWERVLTARRQHWYGFGGAWGEVGESSATTGPLGPHGVWAEDGGVRELPEDRGDYP